MAYFQKYRRGGYGITSDGIQRPLTETGIEKVLKYAPHFKGNLLKNMLDNGIERNVGGYLSALEKYTDEPTIFFIIAEAAFETSGVPLSAMVDDEGKEYLVYDYVSTTKEDSIPNKVIEKVINDYTQLMFDQQVQCDYHYEK